MKVDTTGQEGKRNGENRRDEESLSEMMGGEAKKMGADRAKINNSRDAAGQKQMALGLHGL